MDGPARVGRSLKIEFETDRYASDRIEQAYRLIETLANDSILSESSVQVDPLDGTATANSTSEI